MIEHGDLNSQKLTEELRRYQWGFIPMELNDNNPRYNRFSLPTKIVSYLAAGLGIISVGHTTSTVSGLARRYSFGVSFDETNVGSMSDVLIQALSVDDPWSQFGQEILRCARQEFDATRMRDELHAMFQSQGTSDLVHCFNHFGRIARRNTVRRDAFRYYTSRPNDRSVPYLYPF